MSTTIAQYVLPRLIGAFLDEHPRVQLGLRSGNTEQVVQLVLDGSVAIGLIEGPARERGVHTEPFMRDELVLIVPPNSDATHFSGQQLLASSLLMREQGSGSRHVVEAALEKSGLKLKSFKSVMDLDSTEAIKSAVEAGLGVGFVSRWAISKELELGALRVAQVRGLTMARHFSLVTRTGPTQHRPDGSFPPIRADPRKTSVELGKAASPAPFHPIRQTYRQLKLLLGLGCHPGVTLSVCIRDSSLPA